MNGKDVEYEERDRRIHNLTRCNMCETHYMGERNKGRERAREQELERDR